MMTKKRVDCYRFGSIMRENIKQRGSYSVFDRTGEEKILKCVLVLAWFWREEMQRKDKSFRSQQRKEEEDSEMQGKWAFGC